MGYRKFKADQLFTGYELLNDAKVLITTEEGNVEALVDQPDAGDDIEYLKGIITPGFVNCHCHLELSHMKNAVPEKTGLVDFVFKVVTERHHAEDEILHAISMAEKEMLENGMVAVGDICNNNSTISQKQQKNLRYYNFIESSGWLPELAATRFERAKKLYDEFVSVTPASKVSIVPHAPYSVSNSLWKNIQPFFENKTVSIHNQETAFEDEFFLAGTGDFNRMYEMMKIDNKHHVPTKRSSLQSYFDKLTIAKNVLLVHNTFIKQDDLNYIKLRADSFEPRASANSRLTTNNFPSYAEASAGGGLSTFLCLCVNANLFIEDKLPPISMLMENNCKIVLGTDSLASNWSLNILDEINTIRKYFAQIPIQEILKWATSNGAMALDLNNELGSFEKGKTPGVVLIENDFSSSKKVL